MSWTTFSGKIVSQPIVREVEEAILEAVAQHTPVKVCIGTDSQVHGADTKFATVIVFLRKQQGGFMYVHKDTEKRAYTIKERMLAEVAKSIEVAYQLSELLQQHQVEMEVHADINVSPQYKSHDAMKEAMGYIMGMGYTFRAKPDAFASSCCADRHVG